MLVRRQRPGKPMPPTSASHRTRGRSRQIGPASRSVATPDDEVCVRGAESM